jgi:hypothetical protein
VLTTSPFAPTPDGTPLSVRVACRTTSDGGVPAARHVITIHPDWSVDTGHDLAAERVAVGLGGHCTCVSLVDRGVPALRSWLGRMLRLEGPGLVRHWVGAWSLSDAAYCCDGRTFATAVDAARHGRTMQHAVARFDAGWQAVAVLTAAGSQAYGERFELGEADPDLRRACAACAEGIADVGHLWEAGLTPARVLLEFERSGARGPLPREYYIGRTGVARTSDIDVLPGTDIRRSA